MADGTVKRNEDIQQSTEKNQKCRFLARYTVAVVLFFGMAIGSAVNCNMAVSIVSMVKSTTTSSSSNDTSYSDGTCPAESSITTGSENTNGEFDWDEQTQSLVIGGYGYGSFVAMIPVGYVAVRFGGRRTLIFCMFGISVFSLLSPIAAKTNVILLILCRAFTGVFGSARNPSGHTLLGKWAPPAERSKLSTFVYTGLQIGAITGTIAAGFLCDSSFMGGWPSVFYIMGFLGILWCIAAWFLLYESPSTHPRISDDEREYIESSLGKSIHKKKITGIPWMSILKTPSVWAIVIAQLGQTWMFFALLQELSTYFSSIYHVNASTTSILNALPYLFSWVVSTISSIVADRLRRNKTFSPTVIRKIFQVVSQGGPIAVCLCVAFLGCNYVGAIVVFIVGIGMNGAVFCAHYTNQIDLSPNFAGTLISISGTVGNISSIIAPIVIGDILNNNLTTSGWKTVYLLSAAIIASTTVVYLIFGSSEEQSWNRIEDSTPAEKGADGDIPSVLRSSSIQSSEMDYESIIDRISSARSPSFSIHE